MYQEHADNRPSLSIGERIVWVSDNGPEYGNVRWLGKLPDLGKEWMAGVEFDNPVGSGTGLYKDKQLFVTPLHHASLVPVIGLMKASDYGGQPESPSRSSSNKLIDFNRDPELEFALRESLQSNRDKLTARDSEYHTQPYIRMNHNRQTEQSNDNRIRYIPVDIEHDDEDHRIMSHCQPIDLNRASHSSENRKKSQYSNQNNDTSSLQKVYIDQLESSFKRHNLEDNSPDETEIGRLGQPLLAPPSLVIKAGDDSASMRNLFGKSRGIQGHNNSCYLDATLFAMFSSTTLFDSILYRPANSEDIPKYSEIQSILRDNIVKPLREDNYVSADKVMIFRTMLARASNVAGLTDEEKDPEEFLSLLLGKILKTEPYLKLSTGLESYLYQLIVEKDENVVLPTVQDLFEQSFINGTVRLREIPPCLLLQMPRFGSQYKMYSRIVPSLELDITHVLEAAPRACGERGKDCDNLAVYECRGCFMERSRRNGGQLASITYCAQCFRAKHFSKTHLTGIEDHDKTKTRLDKTPEDAISRFNKASHTKDAEIPKVLMELRAILCIETSHYVCFVKCGEGPDAPWSFFDSMADRRGEQDGHNIPEVILFEEFAFWTSDKGVTYLLNHRDDKLLPEMARRLICDAYLCFYQFPGLSAYR